MMEGVLEDYCLKNIETTETTKGKKTNNNTLPGLR